MEGVSHNEVAVYFALHHENQVGRDVKAGNAKLEDLVEAGNETQTVLKEL